MDTYDVGVIGLGVAGTFACLKIAKEYKNLKIIGFDIGRPPAKRRRQLEGFLGCLPNSDGKLYINDISSVGSIVGSKKAKSSNTWFNDYFSNISNLKVVKDKSPGINISKKINKYGFNIELNNYMQIYPKDIHMLSKNVSKIICNSSNITLNFDNEIIDLTKNKKTFIITSCEGKKIECKKIIVCAGRSGWRWAKQIYEKFNIVENNNFAKFGVRIETQASSMKEFNKSNCNIFNDNFFIGPLSWDGTVIPEDHIDMAISSFRSNENRWKSDKVSFNLIGYREFENKGFEQTNRIGQLTFVLSNDRIVKEKLTSLVNRKSKLLEIPEYNWLPDTIKNIGNFMPEVVNRGYFHVPTILPLIPKIKVNNDLSTEIEGLYCAGESTGITGILSAALTGLISADSVAK